MRGPYFPRLKEKFDLSNNLAMVFKITRDLSSPSIVIEDINYINDLNQNVASL